MKRRIIILALAASMIVPFGAAGQKAKKIKYDFKYDNVDWFHEGLAVVSNTSGRLRVANNRVSEPTFIADKCGVIDSTGREIIPMIYQWIGRFYDGMAPVALNHKYGYVDKNGNETVPLKYDYVTHAFVNGLALVRLDNKYGLVDRQGKEKVPVIYDDITSFSECLAGVCLNKKWGYVDTSGKEVIPVKYEIPALNNFFVRHFTRTAPRDLAEAIAFAETAKALLFAAFSDGVAAVCMNGKWGFIDREDKMVVPLKYDKVRKFKDGMAAVRIDGKWGFVDRTGKEIVAAKYSTVEDFSEGMAAVRADKKWGFVNREGKEIVPLQYSEVKPFCEGCAAVSLKDLWGFVDMEGKEIIPLKYDDILDFSEGLAGVALSKKWGYVDKTGTEVIPPKYARVCNFSEDMAAVGFNKLWGFIDRKGNELIPPKYKKPYSENNIPFKPGPLYPGRFSCGLAPVWNDAEKKFGFVNKTGEMIIPPRYSAVSNFSNGYALAVTFGEKIWHITMELIDSSGKVVVPSVHTDDKKVIKMLNIASRTGNTFMSKYFTGFYVIEPTVFVDNGECGTISDDIFIQMSGGTVKAVRFGIQGRYERPDYSKYKPFKYKGKWGFIDSEGNPLIAPDL